MDVISVCHLVLKTFEIRPFRAALRFESQNSVKQHLRSGEYQENLKFV